jgi:hypothetical protein
MAQRINKDILVLLRSSLRIKTAMGKMCGALYSGLLWRFQADSTGLDTSNSIRRINFGLRTAVNNEQQ